jgi:hypothetical protein
MEGSETGQHGAAGRSLEQLDRRDLRGRQRGLRVPAGVLRHALRRVRQPRHGGLEDPAPTVLQLQLRPLRAREGTITSTSRRDGFTSYVVRSISPHWSVGAFGDVFTSTFDNVDMRYRLMPAVEYSVYPYREATRRQLTIAYRVGGSHVAYRDTTIYDETEQLLPEQTLSAGYEVTQPWGRGGRRRQRLAVPARPRSLQRPVRGQRRRARHAGAVVRSAASSRSSTTSSTSPRAMPTWRRSSCAAVSSRPTTAAGSTSGLRYRFGSIYNNVVNTRFGGGGGQDRF